MAKTDLEKLSVDELETLKKQVGQAIEKRRDRDKLILKEKIGQMVEEAGFTIEELFGKNKGKKPALPPKYRNPKNPMQTWSGRGRRPQWLDEAIAAGKKQEDFLIS